MPAELLQGTRFTDSRGELDFFNTLDLSEVVRMYRIKPADTRTIRAWQGHKLEQKWFYCLKGSFVVNLLPFSEFKDADSKVAPEIYTLDSVLQDVLRIPAGYVNGFRANEENSELLVFSDLSLKASMADDYRFDLAERAFYEPNKK